MRVWCGREASASSRRGRHVAALAGVGIAVLIAQARVTHADESKTVSPKYGWYEVSGGADALRDIWLLYSGVTLAPWSQDIYSDGFRLRVATGYGQYSYKGYALDADKGYPSIKIKFKTETEYADAMIGYYKRLDALTAKAFIGVSAINNSISPGPCHKRGAEIGIDNKGYEIHCNRLDGFDFGFKGAIELWLNLGDEAWTSLDLSYTTAQETASARWRLGWRTLPTLSTGVEARYDRNVEADASRVGSFVRYEWLGGEASLSSGLSGDITGFNTKGLQPYVTFNILFKN